MEIGKNRYNWTGILMAAIGMLFLFSGSVYANGELSVTNLAISPQPVIAGQNISIAFQLYDSYGNLNNVNLGLSGNYPLLNYSPIDTQLISSISQGLYGSSSTFFHYNLKIPQNVQAGTYTLYVTASYLISTTNGGVTSSSSASSSIPISFYVSGSPNIVLTATPASPIVPGSQFNVEIGAHNTGTAGATNVSVTMLNNANFTVPGATSFNLGGISSSGSASASATLEANSTLNQGSSFIPVKLHYTTEYGVNVTKNVSVPVSVIVDRPNLVVSISATQPQTLYAGANQTLTVSIQNVGLGIAKNVTAKFAGTQFITVGSSASNIFIGSIQPGASAQETVFITANRNDNLTSYQLPVGLEYSDANYQNLVQRTAYLNVSLQSSSIFNVTSVSDNLQPGGTYVPVTFTVRNSGSETAQQVTFSLQSIYPIVASNPNVYVSRIAPGQSTNVTFYVNIDAQGNIGNYPVTLYEQWTQPNGATSQQYSGSNNYYAVVYGSNGKSGSSSSGYLWIGAVVVIIIIVGVLYRTGRIKLPMKAKEKKEKK